MDSEIEMMSVSATTQSKIDMAKSKSSLKKMKRDASLSIRQAVMITDQCSFHNPDTQIRCHKSICKNSFSFCSRHRTDGIPDAHPFGNKRARTSLAIQPRQFSGPNITIDDDSSDDR